MSADDPLWRHQFLPRALELTVPVVFVATLLLVSVVYLTLDFHLAYSAREAHQNAQAANLAQWLDRHLTRAGAVIRAEVSPYQDPCVAESRAEYERELTGLPVSRMEIWSQAGLACTWRPGRAPYFLESCVGDSMREPVPVSIPLTDGRRLVAVLDAVCLFSALVPDGAGLSRYLVRRPNPATPARERERWSLVSGEVVAVAPAARWSLAVVVSVPKAQIAQEWLATLPMQASLICGLGLALWFGPMALVRRRLSVEGQVKAALRRGDLFLVYLPTVELASRDWIGAEALLRWRHARHGVLMPTAFIPWIEESPLIYDTTRWVMIQVARDLKHISVRRPDFSVAVNMPPNQLSDQRMLEVADEAFGPQPLALANIVFELTERQEGDFTSPRVREVMQGLRHRGAQFALDDFGVGFSNLALLQCIEVEVVKIDRSFLREDAGSRDAQMLEAMVHLVRKLGVVIIVEGVETEQQLRRVRSCGVHFAQGFLFSRPIELERLLGKLDREVAWMA